MKLVLVTIMVITASNSSGSFASTITNNRDNVQAHSHHDLQQELNQLREEMRSQSYLTSQLQAEVATLRQEFSKSKDDLSAINYKTVSLFNTLEDDIGQVRRTVEVVKSSVSTVADDKLALLANQTAALAQTVERLEGNMLENEMADQLSELETTMVKSDIDLQNHISDLEKELASGKFALSTALQNTDKDLYNIREVTEGLRSQDTQTSTKLESLEESLTSQLKLGEELGELRLRMARDTASVRLAENEWVAVQRRGQHGNPRDYFRRRMVEYQAGFGDPAREFWLGLDKIAKLSESGTRLRIRLENWQGNVFEGEYSRFRVGSGPDFRLSVAGYSGNIGDSLRIDNGMKFSTWDIDQDASGQDCSSARGGGGWWFNACGIGNLNGENGKSGEVGYHGILWFLLNQSSQSLKAVTMEIKKN